MRQLTLAAALVGLATSASAAEPRLEVRALTDKPRQAPLELIEARVVDGAGRDYRALDCRGTFSLHGFEHLVVLRGVPRPDWLRLSADAGGPLIDGRWLAAPRRVAVSCHATDYTPNAPKRDLHWTGELELPGVEPEPGAADARIVRIDVGTARPGALKRSVTVRTSIRPGTAAKKRTVACVLATRFPSVPETLRDVEGLAERVLTYPRVTTERDVVELEVDALPGESTLHCNVSLGEPPSRHVPLDADPLNDFATAAVSVKVKPVPSAPGTVRSVASTGAARATCPTCDHPGPAPAGYSLAVEVSFPKGAWPLVSCRSDDGSVHLTGQAPTPLASAREGMWAVASRFVVEGLQPAFVGPPPREVELECTAWELPSFRPSAPVRQRVRFER